MSRRRRLLLVSGAAVLLVTGAVWYVDGVAPVATGYPAKIVCSGHFVSERPVEDVRGDLPSNPLLPLLSLDVDEDAGRVEARLAGIWRATAWHTEHGCTVADERPAFGPPRGRPAADPRAWPLGDRVDVTVPAGVDAGRLDAAVRGAFIEDDPDGRSRNTRAVLVAHEGAVIAERYADGFGADTALLGWSMAKSVTNAMVGRLAHAGELDVTDAGLLPSWTDRRAQITLDHLLQQRSGLAFDETYAPDTDVTTMLFTPRDAGAYAAAKPLEGAPGSIWSYSSGTTNIICDVLHDVTGQGPRLADELVFGPLGMRTAVMEPDVSGGLVCSSFLYATARDWAKFGQWFLQDGRWDGQQLLPRGWITYTTRPVPAELEPENPYGAHWWLNEGADGELRMPTVPADAFWASGTEGQQVVVVPSADLVVVRLGLSQDFEGIDWGLEALLRGVLDAVGAA